MSLQGEDHIPHSAPRHESGALSGNVDWSPPANFKPWFTAIPLTKRSL